MAVTPRFTWTPVATPVNFDLPHAAYDQGYTRRVSYTSVPLRMANGRTVWQRFAIQGDENASYIYFFSLRWVKLAAADLTTLLSVYQVMLDLSPDNHMSFRSPENLTWNVTIDPDNRDLNITPYQVASVMYYRGEIHLVQDTA